MQPAAGEGFVAGGFAIFEAHQGDTVAGFLAAIPRAVLGDEDLVAVFGGEHRPGVKAQAERRDVGAECLCRRREFVAGTLAAEFGVANGVAVTVWIAKVHAGLRGVVQLARRAVVAQPVAAIVGEPECF